MTLGIFLQPGESFKMMSKSGQDVRLIDVYIKSYLKKFENIYIFSYENERYKLPKNVYLVPNPTKLHRLLYAMLLPILQKKYVDKCDVVRGLGFASSLSAFFMQKPFVVNWAYDYYSFVLADKKYIYLPLYFILEKLTFLRSKKVFIATRSKMDKLNNQKFIYLPNGVDLSIFKPTKKNGFGLIFIGRLEPQKNLSFLFEAMSKIPDKFKKLTIIGRGSQKDLIIKLAKEKNVKLNLIEQVPNTKLSKIMKDYSIFLLPSLNEGIPKVLIEAMSMGLVPIVTNFPTAREVINNNIDGFITGYNHKVYAQKIEILLTDNELYNKMSQNAREKIEQEFNQDILIKREIKVLQSVLNI